MTQKARTSLGLETGPVRPSASQPGGKDDGQDLAARLAKALKREGDRESGLNFHERTYWRPIAERIAADAELLDAIVAYHRPPRAYAVVDEDLSDAIVFETLAAANTAEGIASGHNQPGGPFMVLALIDVTEEP